METRARFRYFLYNYLYYGKMAKAIFRRHLGIVGDSTGVS